MLCHTICIYDFVHLVNVRSYAHSQKHTRIYLKLHNYFAVKEVKIRKKLLFYLYEPNRQRKILESKEIIHFFILL